MSELVRRIVGAVLGGALGYVLFWMLVREGYYAIALVGAGVALGAGQLARTRRLGLGVLVGVLAVVATALVDWQHSRWAEESLWTFVTNARAWSSRSQLSYLAVALAGVWFGMGRERPAVAATRA